MHTLTKNLIQDDLKPKDKFKMPRLFSEDPTLKQNYYENYKHNKAIKETNSVLF